MRFRVPFVLASASPRRRQLLELIGIDFRVQPSHADESTDGSLAPDELVRQIAARKCMSVGRELDDALVLGADTIVVLDGEVLGKPQDEADAGHMLRRLSGNTHVVYSGIALYYSGADRMVNATAATRVTFDDLSDGEIAAYVAGGSPMDKAGAYGIQDDRGALFVSRIDGDYYNVVGLPMNLLYRTLKSEFSDLIVETPSS